MQNILINETQAKSNPIKLKLIHSNRISPANGGHFNEEVQRIRQYLPAKLLLMKTRSRNSFPVRSRKIAGCARKIGRESRTVERRKMYSTDHVVQRAERGLKGEGDETVLRRRACLLVEKFWSRRSVSSLQPQLHLRVIRLTSGMRILRNPVFARIRIRSFSSSFSSIWNL